MSDESRDRNQSKGMSRRAVLKAGAATGATTAVGGLTATQASALGHDGRRDQDGEPERIRLVNGEIHTMDPDNPVVSSVTIEDGRFVQVGRNGDRRAGDNAKTINLRGRTVVPGIIDAHNHIVLVGNRPGHHVLVEHVFTVPEALEVYKNFAKNVPAGEWITTIGPIAARQFEENRLPTLQELDDTVPDHPVYVHAADSGGSRTNSMGRAILEPLGVEVQDDGSIPGGGGFGSGDAATTVQFLRATLLSPETRRRSAHGALRYYASLGITMHKDSSAFHDEEPAGGIATENIFTMHEPFIELDRNGQLPARMRFDFGHYDGGFGIIFNPGAPPPDDIPTLRQRLKNSFPYYGNDWLRTGGIGEHTGAGVPGLRAIAEARWRAEDHALNLGMAEAHIANREVVHAETDISELRWILSHVPAFPPDLADRFHAMGGGVLVGWGPLRTGTDVGPPYRDLFDHPIEVGWHSDGGDISLINPWLNLYTMTTGRNLQGDHILGDQTLTRQEALWLATAANRWFINEDDIGSIEVGNHADLAVLNKNYFTVPDEDIRTIRSQLTIIGGHIVHDDPDGGRHAGTEGAQT
ncbi:MAG TPA: amidohydrolase family protein [Jiangellaceae bacterium]